MGTQWPRAEPTRCIQMWPPAIIAELPTLNKHSFNSLSSGPFMNLYIIHSAFVYYSFQLQQSTRKYISSSQHKTMGQGYISVWQVSVTRLYYDTFFIILTKTRVPYTNQFWTVMDNSYLCPFVNFHVTEDKAPSATFLLQWGREPVGALLLFFYKTFRESQRRKETEKQTIWS